MSDITLAIDRCLGLSITEVFRMFLRMGRVITRDDFHFHANRKSKLYRFDITTRCARAAATTTTKNFSGRQVACTFDGNAIFVRVITRQTIEA